jgi:hypothetical protein
MALKYLTIDKFSAESGYTKEAIRSKIKRGQWLEGREWIKAPDGRNLISVEGYERWVEGQACVPPVGRVSK